MNFKLPTNFQSSGHSKYWMFSSGLPPQNQTTPFFLVYSIGCLVLLHPLFPSFSLFMVFFFFVINFMTWLVFEPWEKPFQNSNHALDKFLNILRENWKVLTSNFMVFYNPFLWTMWIWSHPRGMEDIHENSWNLRRMK